MYLPDAVIIVANAAIIGYSYSKGNHSTGAMCFFVLAAYTFMVWAECHYNRGQQERLHKSMLQSISNQ